MSTRLWHTHRALLAAGRVAFSANEWSRDVVQARFFRRVVVPDPGSSTETESFGLRVDLARVHTDRCAGFQDHRRELEGRRSVSDICKCPSAYICARTTRVRNLDVLVGFRTRDDAIETMQDILRTVGSSGVGGVSTVAVDNTFSVGVTVEGSGTVVGVGTSGVGVGDAARMSGVDVSSGAWMVGVIVFVASACGEGIGDGFGRGWAGSTRAMGVAGSAAQVVKRLRYPRGIDETSIVVESFG